MTTRIDISIGPVQGFIEQSRRTRDLWGGSFLLAFLAAHAMKGAEGAGGKIIQPQVDDDNLFKWVSDRPGSKKPTYGTTTNHFAVETTKNPKDVADAAKASFDKAWQRVCDTVWDKYLKDAASDGNGTKVIWDRQVKGFWEFTWAAGKSGPTSESLARRKHWRTHRPTDEPGDKCAVMPDLQELSGYIRATAKGREDQKEFWEKVRCRASDLDVRDNEQLCAIALVKRLFPRVSEKAVGWELDGANWASTAYMAAVPWMKRAIAAAPDEARAYAEMVDEYARDNVFPMRNPPFEGLNDRRAGNFPKLDGNFLSVQTLKNEKLCRLKESAENNAARDRLAKKLKAIYDAEDEGSRLGPPSSFYALLFADGDRLGKLLEVVGKEKVSEAVSSFVKAVPSITEEYDGVTIYAGGEDVLVMLPVDKAIECAKAIADAYTDKFPAGTNNATMSAAVVFAHSRGVTLSAALKEGRRLLAEVAKDGNGRDSLAVSVLKPSGRYCEWVSSWNRRDEGAEKGAVALLRDLEGALQWDGDMPGLSSSLIYRIRELLTMLCDWDRWAPGALGEIPPNMDMKRIERLLRAEVLHSLEGRMKGDEEARTKRAKELTQSIVNLLNPSRKIELEDGGASKVSIERKKVGVDALMLARFLSNPDDEREMPL